jgi:hypothetical protein
MSKRLRNGCAPGTKKYMSRHVSRFYPFEKIKKKEKKKCAAEEEEIKHGLKIPLTERFTMQEKRETVRFPL